MLYTPQILHLVCGLVLLLFTHIFQGYINGLLQDCSNSSASAMELLQSCMKLLICNSLELYKPWKVNDSLNLPRVIISTKKHYVCTLYGMYHTYGAICILVSVTISPWTSRQINAMNSLSNYSCQLVNSYVPHIATDKCIKIPIFVLPKICSHLKNSYW